MCLLQKDFINLAVLSHQRAGNIEGAKSLKICVRYLSLCMEGPSNEGKHFFGDLGYCDCLDLKKKHEMCCFHLGFPVD